MAVRTGRMMAAAGALALTMSACGGGGGVVTLPATEQGAADAVIAAQRGVLDGDGDAVIGFMSDECRATVDEGEVRMAVRFVEALFQDEDVALGEIEIVTSVEAFDGDTAEVAVEYLLPDGVDEGLFFGDTTVDVMYENGRWVAEECEFGDQDQIEADELGEQLASLGYAGTRDEPVPFGVAAPVGTGFTVSVDAIDTDAYDTITEGGAFYGEPEEGNAFVLVDITVGYSGEEEPQSVGDLSVTVVGGQSSVGHDLYGCSGFERELDAYGTSLMVGGVTSGALCGEVPIDDIDGLAIAIGRSFSDNTVFFDPAATGDPVAVSGVTGPQPAGELTDGRQAPIAVGTATDVGEGWTLTVNGVNADAAAVIAASEFNDPAPAGFEYVLVDVSMAFEGDGSMSASAVSLDLVGDSNVTVGGGDCSVSFDGELDRFAEVFSPGEVSGEVCFLVPSGDVASAVLLASAAWGDDPEVLALR